jgi:hypothetical protein
LRESVAIDFATARSAHSLPFVQERAEDRIRAGPSLAEIGWPDGRSRGFVAALPALRQSISLGAGVARPADSMHRVPWPMDGIYTAMEADTSPHA